MSTTKQMIKTWLERAIDNGATHLIVVCDTFEYEDYPVNVLPADLVDDVIKKYDGKNMQKVMEVYNLNQNVDEQLDENRVWNL